ncbi:unnamed protein product [Didymodactylos carnosus]|uniref:AB hydrolase-1 domain-containing protein n=1 Tax=Didymodactylos carnosus TaxID=1234261 RepID=A0A813Q9L2_9BILA|nr:unnamed protein product [Didymodactylos carnosus]CAF0763958.1 unnamed protein product [Didymodactylos carnosus]CAF3534290.1 unnamed protein product [Didymodactylos carnosus]CAF3545110.1 unnamed protein product [Didymodactylos carnosus]
MPPERATSSEYGQHAMIKLKSSDVTLHYISKGLPNQPMILFVHGFPECWYSWRFQLKYFSKKYRVVAIDTRGYGLSSKPLYVSDYTAHELAGDVADVIEQLGYDTCILVGHDWVEKLVIMNSPHPQVFRSDLSWTQLKRSWYMFYHQCPIIPELILQSNDFELLESTFLKKPMGLVNTINMDHDDIEVYKYTFAQRGTAKSAINYYRAMFRYQFDLSHSYISAPTLLIWGLNDATLGEELCDGTAKYCADLRIRKIPNVSHWVQQDAPTQCNTYIDVFLNEHSLVENTLDF